MAAEPCNFMVVVRQGTSKGNFLFLIFGFSAKQKDLTLKYTYPAKPANVPTSVTPPFVPGGTCRRFQDVRSLGLLLERIPSSEENVSAETAA